MKPIKVAALGAMFVAFASAAWFATNRSGEESSEVADPEPAATAFDSSAPLAQRIAALEQAVRAEREARQLLQEEVLVLHETIESLQSAELDTAVTPDDEPPPDARRSRRAVDAAARRERRTQRLVDAGFTPSEADWILKRESELQMQALQARYDARRAGESIDFFAGRGAAANALRQELGDAGYERYREAGGQPTRVAISSVFEGSPALTAGLRPGDQIVSYDGQRVFSMSDITALTMQGEPGQNVVVDITRDGIPMQVSLPRGPLGVTGGRRFPQ